MVSYSEMGSADRYLEHGAGVGGGDQYTSANCGPTGLEVEFLSEIEAVVSEHSVTGIHNENSRTDHVPANLGRSPTELWWVTFIVKTRTRNATFATAYDVGTYLVDKPATRIVVPRAGKTLAHFR